MKKVVVLWTALASVSLFVASCGDSENVETPEAPEVIVPEFDDATEQFVGVESSGFSKTVELGYGEVIESSPGTEFLTVRGSVENTTDSELNVYDPSVVSVNIPGVGRIGTIPQNAMVSDNIGTQAGALAPGDKVDVSWVFEVPAESNVEGAVLVVDGVGESRL